MYSARGQAKDNQILALLLESAMLLDISFLQDENLHDVMEFLLALVFEDPNCVVVKMVEDLEGLKLEFSLPCLVLLILVSLLRGGGSMQLAGAHEAPTTEIH